MSVSIDELLHALTRAVNALAAADVPFAVAGGCAVYARGGPASQHDVDLLVKPGDCDRAVRSLARAGLRVCDPPEDWLRKVYAGNVLVDVIYRPNDRPVTDELLNRATTMRIGPAKAPVVSGTDLMVDKMLVFDAHRLNFAPLLHIARDLREQVDWAQVAEQTRQSPYARAFLGLLLDLEIVTASQVDGASGETNQQERSDR
ncbi:nucleotidyltransferase family protein [Nocardia arizonensis]|uniref:nucleotidyltransferase family protein n=1 Tax=Nocardia arizonensis TaxID=1141647 RepID=UPI0006CFEB31|nr:nucleotidyltransferase family protein [Nocardia arizonensis]